jgi:hypothetical protein
MQFVVKDIARGLYGYRRLMLCQQVPPYRMCNRHQRHVTDFVDHFVFKRLAPEIGGLGFIERQAASGEGISFCSRGDTKSLVSLERKAFAELDLFDSFLDSLWREQVLVRYKKKRPSVHGPLTWGRTHGGRGLGRRRTRVPSSSPSPQHQHDPFGSPLRKGRSLYEGSGLGSVATMVVQSPSTPTLWVTPRGAAFGCSPTRTIVPGSLAACVVTYAELRSGIPEPDEGIWLDPVFSRSTKVHALICHHFRKKSSMISRSVSLLTCIQNPSFLPTPLFFTNPRLPAAPHHLFTSHYPSFEYYHRDYEDLPRHRPRRSQCSRSRCCRSPC